MLKTRLVRAMSGTKLLDSLLRSKAVVRRLWSTGRAAQWSRRFATMASAEERLRFDVLSERAGVWICEPRMHLDPVELFVEAFDQCLLGSDAYSPAEFGVLERDGGRYPAIEMSERAWSALVTAWGDGGASWNLHVQDPAQRSRPECVRAASARTLDAMACRAGRSIVFVAVSHPSSPLPVGRRLGVDVFVRPQIDLARVQQPWGSQSLTDWVRALRRPPFPIDAVYTWVDDGDPSWQERRRGASVDDVIVNDSASTHRFANRDELRYSLRSVALYAEWLNGISVVTDAQTPDWASAALRVVDHRQILDAEVLPTFNSHAIETALHRVPALNERYLYMNDDVFFDSPAPWSLFFVEDGRSRFFVSQAVIPARGRETTTIDHATSNGRELVRREFGVVIGQKMKHTPQTQRRSVHEWMETTFFSEHRETSASRFRSARDQSFASFLHHYVGFQLGEAVPGRNLQYDYFNAAGGSIDTRLASLRDRPGRFTTYCINDGDVPADERTEVDNKIQRHLEMSLPFPTVWEL